MQGRLIVVAGTGTSIGKTHLTEALVLAWRRETPTARVVGLKPIESGVVDPAHTDAARLLAVSSFHVKQSGYAFAAPISPHLAARDEGIEIRPEWIIELIQHTRQQAEVLVVELPGGLFTPITSDMCNADLAAALTPDSLLLVAPDRLGVLHDVVATTRAASTTAVRIDGIVLMAPDRSDASTGRNGGELPRATGIPVVAILPRGSPAALSELPSLRQLVAALRAPGTEA